MKCPNCGMEIPEGHMYCDNCGEEINFVPDFEPEVENQITATLSEVADELNKEERLKREKKERQKKRKEAVISFITNWRVILGAVVLVGLVMGGIYAYNAYNEKTALYYMSLADKARTSGNYEEAIGYLETANREFPGNSDVIFRMSDYYLEEGKEDEAVNALLLISSSGLFPEDKVMSSYESIISIYKQSGDNEKLRQFLSNSDDSQIKQLRTRYVPNMPSVSPTSGTYDVVNVSMKMNDGSGNSIYYTVNDGTPDSGSILYQSEIVLDADGVYEVKAVAVNNLGISSVVATAQYVIEKGAPLPPEIMEPSGDYNQNTMIVAVAEAGCSIFYTTDGRDPTLNSKQYISPITMPVGTSHFKFIAYDNDGNCSEIVERNYHLVYSRLVSAEQAVQRLVSTLVRLDILLDNAGTVRGIDGHYEYIYNSIIEIEGAGEYYVVVENHVFNDGTTAPTGLMYAVNTHDGTVNRLGYDSSGKYTLITISNR